MRRSTRVTSWRGFRSVLCAIDFSEHSRVALRFAAAIAARGNGALTAVHINDPLLVSAAAVALHDRQIVRRSARALQAFVDATLATPTKTPLRVASRVSIGDPSDEIIKAIGRARADLVVIGTHGLSGADRLLLGSTTLSLLQRTNVPVLAVPLIDQKSPRAVPSWPGERIAAAIELDAASRIEVETAARLAQWFGSALLLFHVVGHITAPAWLRGDLSAHERIRVAQAQRELDALAASAATRVRTEGRVACGRIGDEIAALAATEGTGLIITALRDRRGWFGARRGSLSYQVLSHAVAPVLAHPSSWRPR